MPKNKNKLAEADLEAEAKVQITVNSILKVRLVQFDKVQSIIDKVLLPPKKESNLKNA